MTKDYIKDRPDPDDLHTVPIDRSDRFVHPEDATDWAHYNDNIKRIQGDFLGYFRKKRRESLSEVHQRSNRKHNRTAKKGGSQ